MMDANELTTEVVAGVHLVETRNVNNSGSTLIDMIEAGEASNSKSGQRVTPTNAIQYAPVYQAVRLLSGDVAKLDLTFCRREGSLKIPLWDHPLTDLVNRRPNRDLNAFKFWSRTVQHLALWGNAYIWILRDTGELIHLLPNRTYLYNQPSELNPNGETFYIATTHGGGLTATYYPEEVIHLELLQDVNAAFGAGGVNTTQQARNSWGLGISQEEFASRFFAAGGRIGGILEIPWGHTDQSAQNLEEGFVKKYEDGRLAFRTVILRDGAKFHESQRSFEETQLVQSKEQNARDVSRWFNMPAMKLNVAESTSYNDKAEDQSIYLDTTLEPILSSITAELNFKLIPSRMERDHYFAFDTSAIVRESFSARMNAYSVGIGGGVLKQNEARARENLPPVPGGDQVKDVNAPPPSMANGQQADDRGGQADDQDQDDQENRSRIGRVVFGLTEHARERAGKGQFGKWVQNLDYHREKALALLGSAELVEDFQRQAIGLEGPDQVDRLATRFEVEHAHAQQS